ncbi:MAG: methyl-accepting chemotaxis protein [Thermodesulfobacteriota bacterium]|nr:methyl-accepting chemotaxis protein [Thermodesulfobacteriota bacterium]
MVSIEMNELANTIFKFYSRLFNMVGSLAEKCRYKIPNTQNYKAQTSDADCCLKELPPFKEEINKQQNVFLPFVAVLREQKKHLTDMSGNTEDEFLSLGARLQDFSSSAKSLSEQSAYIAGLFGGSRQGNPLDQAGRVSEETLAILKCNAETVEATSRIISITEKSKELFKHKRDFNVISRTLRMLGTNIRIQSTQIKEGSDSVFLADKVSELTVTTDIIVNKMFDYLKTADASMASIAGKINKHTQKHREQVEQTEKKINNALGRLKGMFDLSTALSANIASRFSEILKRVGEVVMSVQFHDISRQKMEHVAQAIEDICNNIEEKAAFDSGCGENLAANISKISNVQMSQLDLLAHEMENVEKKLITALEKMACRISEQSEEISMTSKAGRTESDNSIIVQFASELSTVISSLSENTENNRLILRDVKAVSKTVNEMSSFVEDVKNIAENIKLLALNAQIEAEHIGKSGLSLGVLAREIRDISAKSDCVVGEVSTGIKAILEIADDLQTVIGSVFAKGVKETEDLKQRVAEAKNALDGLNREMAENIAELDKKSKKLAHHISAITSEIQFSKKVVKRIGYIRKTMQELIETAKPYLIEIESDVSKLIMDELTSRYTMENERIAHEMAFSSPAKEDGDETNFQTRELCNYNVFPGSNEDTQIDDINLCEESDASYGQNEESEIFGQRVKDDDDLGDNIELF